MDWTCVTWIFIVSVKSDSAIKAAWSRAAIRVVETGPLKCAKNPQRSPENRKATPNPQLADAGSSPRARLRGSEKLPHGLTPLQPRPEGWSIAHRQRRQIAYDRDNVIFIRHCQANESPQAFIQQRPKRQTAWLHVSRSMQRWVGSIEVPQMDLALMPAAGHGHWLTRRINQRDPEPLA